MHVCLNVCAKKDKLYDEKVDDGTGIQMLQINMKHHPNK